MRDPDTALARWVSRAPWWLRTLSLRRDLALPLVLLVVQLAGTAIAGKTSHLFDPQRPLEAVDWVLLAVGPVALVARRRHPVPVLWVCFAATLTPAASGFAHGSLIVAFFVFLVVQWANKMKKPAPVVEVVPTTKECPFCASAIPIKAVRCPMCTSELKGK